MIGFVLMMAFLLGFVCCSAVESFFVPPDDPDAPPASSPPWWVTEAEASVDAWARVRAYKATGAVLQGVTQPTRRRTVWHRHAKVSCRRA
jgi:hypothetical protein